MDLRVGELTGAELFADGLGLYTGDVRLGELGIGPILTRLGGVHYKSNFYNFRARRIEIAHLQVRWSQLTFHKNGLSLFDLLER